MRACVCVCVCEGAMVISVAWPVAAARIGYATEGALCISTDAVSPLRNVWVPIRLWKQYSVQART